jgi:predicted DNA-binding WGR domain protein
MSYQNLPANTVYSIHLRAPSTSGGKDWVGAVTNTEMHAFWGKTGQINQHQPKPGNMTTLQKLINEKLGKGYQQVDDYTQKDGWASQRQQAASQSSTPKPKPVRQQNLNPIINWNEAPAPTSALEWDF